MSNFNEQIIQDFEESINNLGKEYYPNEEILSNEKKGFIFEKWATKNIFGIDPNERIFFGQTGDHGIDIGVIDDEKDTILLVQCKYSDLSSDTTFDNEPIDQLLNGIRMLESDEDVLNNDFRDLRGDYKRLKDLKLIRKVVCVTGRLNDDAILNAKQNDVEIYDKEDIIEIIRYQESYFLQPPDEIKIKSEKEALILRKNNEEEIKLVLSPINVTQIYDLLKSHNDALFLKNLRFRLPPSRGSKIGKMIKDEVKELLDKANGDINYELETLNNGLNIICDLVIIEEQEVFNGEFILVKPQIVNGCQTCWAIHDAVRDFMRENKMALNDIKQEGINVWAKIIPIEDEKQKQKIAQATNTQNPINKLDMRSADEYIHLPIKNMLGDHSISIFYEHKRGGWDSTKSRSGSVEKFKGLPKNYRILTMKEFGQLSMAFQGKQNIARSYTKDIFDKDELYEDAFDINKMNVEIRGNTISWIESILFAKAIKSIAEVVKSFYTKKDYDIKEAIRNENSEYRTIDEYKRARSIFVEYKDSVRYWNYILIALIKKIIDAYCNHYNKTCNVREIFT